VDTAIYAAIMGAAVGGIIAFAGGMVTGLLLYWLEGKRLKRKWQREDAVRHEQWLREDGLREAEWNREEVLRREQSLRRSI
jgi:membrane protein DedA with SNARE-associated domain